MGKTQSANSEYGKRTYFLERVVLFAIALLLVIANIFGVYRDNTKYLSDSGVLLRIARGDISDYGDRSYGNVALLYRALGFHNNVVIAENLVLSLFLFSAILSINLNAWRLVCPNLPITKWLFVITSLLLCSLYFRIFTKEFIPLLINLLIGIYVSRSNNYWRSGAVIFTLSLTYAFLFRNYWFIVAILTFVLLVTERLVRNQRVDVKKWVVFCFIIGLSLSNTPLLNLSGKLNERRIGADFANSAFTNIPELLQGSLIYPIKLLAFIFPFPFVQKSNLQLVFAWAAFVLMFFFAFKALRNQSNPDWRVNLLSNYVIAFILTLGIFEPDYGSFAKHMAPFLPLVFRIISHNVSSINERQKT